MALIVEYHVIAAQYKINSALTSIKAGAPVEITTGQEVIVATDDSALCIGIAGDTIASTEGKTTAYSTQLKIGSNGATSRGTENRVSDFYNETAASGRLTVYQSGGKFWISSDMFATTPTAGMKISTNTAASTTPFDQSGTNVIAIALSAPTAYSSGVPGVDTTDGSNTLGNYVPVILKV
jgi:hypothetical protein